MAALTLSHFSRAAAVASLVTVFVLTDCSGFGVLFMAVFYGILMEYHKLK